MPVKTFVTCLRFVFVTSKMASRDSNSKKDPVVVMNPAVKEITVATPGKECNFCWRSDVNALEWGPMYTFEDITLHYFCLVYYFSILQAFFIIFIMHYSLMVEFIYDAKLAFFFGAESKWRG